MTHTTLMGARPAVRNTAWPADENDLLTRVDALLAEGRPREALALIPRTDSPWIRNARGVCLLRLGRPNEAIGALRDLVFDHTGFAIRRDAEPVFQANYATALLLDGNAEGFWSVLGGIGDRTHPAVARLDDAVRRWQTGMTLGQRVASALGIGGRGSSSISRPAICNDPWRGDRRGPRPVIRSRVHRAALRARFSNR